jgi:hypothetical protein
MRVLSLLLILAWLLSPPIAICQSPDEKLAPADKAEVMRLAESFSAQIHRTRDLTPYLKTPAATSIAKAWFEDSDLISHDLVPRMRPDDLQRFYFSLTNIAYLSQLYIYTQVYLKNMGVRDVPRGKQYPSNVVRFLKNNPTTRAWSAPDEFSEPMSTALQVRNLTRTFERASTMMRYYFRAHPPERTRMYRKNLAWIQPQLKRIKVESCDSKNNCLGYPAHSQFIVVELPVLELHLVRANGKLDILVIGLLEGLW